MKKKVICLLLTLVFMLSVVGTAPAKQINTRKIKNEKLLHKYAVEFKELEKELKKIEVKINENNKLGLKHENDKIKEGIVTRNIQEVDGTVTLAMPYSTEAVIGTDYTVTVTHAKLFTKSTWTDDDGWGSLQSIEGEVLEYYDGATCPQIEGIAGQYSAWTPLSNRTEEFNVYTDNYNETYSWPDIGFSPGHDLGHSAKFTIVRGATTRVWEVICNKNEKNCQEI